MSDSCHSLIDDTFMNTLEYETVSGNLIASVSDHLSNSAFLANGKVMEGKDRSLVGDYSSFKSEKYIENLSVTSIHLIKSMRNFTQKYLTLSISMHPLNSKQNDKENNN